MPGQIIIYYNTVKKTEDDPISDGFRVGLLLLAG